LSWRWRASSGCQTSDALLTTIRMIQSPLRLRLVLQSFPSFPASSLSFPPVISALNSEKHRRKAQTGQRPCDHAISASPVRSRFGALSVVSGHVDERRRNNAPPETSRIGSQTASKKSFQRSLVDKRVVCLPASPPLSLRRRCLRVGQSAPSAATARRASIPSPACQCHDPCPCWGALACTGMRRCGPIGPPTSRFGRGSPAPSDDDDVDEVGERFRAVRASGSEMTVVPGADGW